jgi:hypothetical protein
VEVGLGLANDFARLMLHDRALFQCCSIVGISVRHRRLWQ